MKRNKNKTKISFYVILSLYLVNIIKTIIKFKLRIEDDRFWFLIKKNIVAVKFITFILLLSEGMKHVPINCTRIWEKK